MEITRTFTREVGTFVENRANEADALKRELETEINKGEQADPKTLTELTLAYDNARTWENGGAARRITTALTAAASGNVTGSALEFARDATVNFVQSLTVTQVKAIADGFGDTKEPVRAALHSLVACGGAAARGQDCGSAAIGAASAVVINAALSDPADLSASERQARENLVTTLISGGAAAGGSTDLANTTTSAQIETQNNSALVGGGALLLGTGATLIVLAILDQKANEKPGQPAQKWLGDSQKEELAELAGGLGLDAVKRTLLDTVNVPTPTPRYSEAERQQARDDLTTALSSYDYLTKNSDPIYAQNALDRAKKIAEEHGFKLEAFDGGVRIATGTPGFPADSRVSIPSTVETPISQPGKNDGRYATPAHSTKSTRRNFRRANTESTGGVEYIDAPARGGLAGFGIFE